MTRCNIRNGTQNEIKRHCGPQRARSNPRYGNLKGKNANSPPPPDSSRIPLFRAASSLPGFLRGKEGWGRASPRCRVAVPSSPPATGPAEPSRPHQGPRGHITTGQGTNRCPFAPCPCPQGVLTAMLVPLARSRELPAVTASLGTSAATRPERLPSS